MKKIILKFLLITMMTTSVLTGCTYQFIDTTYNFDYAIIQLPNGKIVEGKIKSWKDYDGEQLQIVIDDTTYLTHSENVVMIAR